MTQEQKFTAMMLRRSGKRLQEIGDMFGVTREYIRQICKKHGVTPPPKPQQWPVPNFKLRMFAHLREAGFLKCYECRLWFSAELVWGNRCHDCGRAAARRRRATPQGKAYEEKYKREHPEVQRRATKRWLSKRMQDPKFVEKRRAYFLQKAKARYQRLRSTPEGRDKLRQQSAKANQKRRERAQ